MGKYIEYCGNSAFYYVDGVTTDIKTYAQAAPVDDVQTLIPEVAVELAKSGEFNRTQEERMLDAAKNVLLLVGQGE